MRKHEPKKCVKCGEAYIPTSGPQKFCTKCLPPACEGCKRIKLAVQEERNRIIEILLANKVCMHDLEYGNCPKVSCEGCWQEYLDE